MTPMPRFAFGSIAANETWSTFRREVIVSLLQ